MVLPILLATELAQQHRPPATNLNQTSIISVNLCDVVLKLYTEYGMWNTYTVTQYTLHRRVTPSHGQFTTGVVECSLLHQHEQPIVTSRSHVTCVSLARAVQRALHTALIRPYVHIFILHHSSWLRVLPIRLNVTLSCLVSLSSNRLKVYCVLLRVKIEEPYYLSAVICMAVFRIQNTFT